MKSYKLVHHLLEMVEKLENENNGSEISIRDFAGFLVNNLDGPNIDMVNAEAKFGKNEPRVHEQAYQLDNNIGRLFVYMSRYAKSYIKKALEDTALQTPEEFTCLAILMTHDHLSKSELISRNLQEKTSGTEVIRRLLAAGLATQWDDNEDKRGKRIAITDKGKSLLYVVFKDMSNVGRMVTGKLTVSEKLTLQYLLQKLETFHYHHFEQKTILNKADLIAVAQSLAV